MRDLIDRQALCDDLREYKVHPVPISSDESEVKGYNDGIDLAISVIAEFPSAEPERKWIPVTEALPEEETEVLVTFHFDGYKDAYTNLKPTDYVGVASQIGGEWSAYEYKVAPRKHHVIAWMPLIEPWRGE